MKRVVYFDGRTGAAGNMILASLLDAGAAADWVQQQLRKMPLGRWSWKLQKVKKNGIVGLHLSVSQGPQSERNLDRICRLIDGGKYSATTAERAKRIFKALARAEARVHGTTMDRVHFHEVGAVDAIVDIVGTCLALEYLKIEQVFSSPLNLGSGQLECLHGMLPVPAPATAWLLKGARVYQNELTGELVTPTGAAILAVLSAGFGPLPEMVIESVGHGTGSRNLETPNILRALVGKGSASNEQVEDAVLLETNIDDMNPQIYQHLLDGLKEGGALDVWMTPIYAKKNRPGIILSALVPPEKELSAVDIIFRETTTAGIRRRAVARYLLPRESIVVRTRFGPVRGKRFLRGGGAVRFQPEYRDCRRLARAQNMPLWLVQEEALRAWRKNKASNLS